MRRRPIAPLVIVVGVSMSLATAPSASAAGRPFATTLSGAAELPGPGDPDATGTAFITVNPGTGEVCWSVSVENVDLPIVAAHIHVGAVDTFGVPVVFLLDAGQTDADGSFSGCRTVDRALALALVRTPENYYVNVHTALFPAGAARGQLG